MLRDFRTEAMKVCERENPPPCDPDLCGISCVPCPRCQTEYVENFITLYTKQEKTTLRGEAEKKAAALWKAKKKGRTK